MSIYSSEIVMKNENVEERRSWRKKEIKRTSERVIEGDVKEVIRKTSDSAMVW